VKVWERGVAADWGGGISAFVLSRGGGGLKALPLERVLFFVGQSYGWGRAYRNFEESGSIRKRWNYRYNPVSR